MQSASSARIHPLHKPAADEVTTVVSSLLTRQLGATASHLYIELLRHGFRNGWDLGGLDLRHVGEIVTGQGFTIDAKSGRVTRRSSNDA